MSRAAVSFDPAFFEQAKGRLYASVLSDVLDGMGHRHHAMHPGLRPLDDGAVLFGRARTGRYVETSGAAPGANPYAVEIALVDDLKPCDVAVFDCAGTEAYAAWGELLTTAARARGAVGAVIDGQSRDVALIRDMGFPVFCRSIGMLDAAGRAEMQAFDIPITCGGVTVRPGDLVFGDVDGVLVLPAEAAAEAVDRAIRKAEGENLVRAELQRGDKLADVFARHGIL